MKTVRVYCECPTYVPLRDMGRLACRVCYLPQRDTSLDNLPDEALRGMLRSACAEFSRE